MYLLFHDTGSLCQPDTGASEALNQKPPCSLSLQRSTTKAAVGASRPGVLLRPSRENIRAGVLEVQDPQPALSPPVSAEHILCSRHIVTFVRRLGLPSLLSRLLVPAPEERSLKVQLGGKMPDSLLSHSAFPFCYILQPKKRGKMRAG